MVALLFGTNVWGLDTAVEEAEPAIRVLESDHDFGNVQVGQGAYWTLRVSNEGGGNLSIVSYQIVPEEAEFFFDEERLPTEWTIAPGEALELPLFFAPTSSGPQEGTLVIREQRSG